MEILNKYDRLINSRLKQYSLQRNKLDDNEIKLQKLYSIELDKIRQIQELVGSADFEIQQAQMAGNKVRLQQAFQNRQLVDETIHEYLKVINESKLFQQLARSQVGATAPSNVIQPNPTPLQELKESFQSNLKQKLQRSIQQQLSMQEQLSNQVVAIGEQVNLQRLVENRLGGQGIRVPEKLAELPRYFSEKQRLQTEYTQPLSACSANDTAPVEAPSLRPVEKGSHSVSPAHLLDQQKLAMEAESLRGEIAVLKEIIRVKDEQLARGRSDTIDRPVDEMQIILDTLNEQKAEIEQLNQKCREYQEQIDQGYTEKLERDNRQLKEKYNQLLEKTKFNTDYGGLIKEQEKSIRVLECDNTQLKIEVKDLRTQNERYKSELTSTQLLIDKNLTNDVEGDLRQELLEKNREIDELQGKLAAQAEKIQEIGEEFQGFQQQIEMKDKLIAQLRGQLREQPGE